MYCPSKDLFILNKTLLDLGINKFCNTKYGNDTRQLFGLKPIIYNNLIGIRKDIKDFLCNKNNINDFVEFINKPYFSKRRLLSCISPYHHNTDDNVISYLFSKQNNISILYIHLGFIVSAIDNYEKIYLKDSKYSIY